ncbi:MFS transporter [Nocardioides sp. BGMRC 2183]|nr:MFS transporter [Nocardioides sp. BGMRC 2183]
MPRRAVLVAALISYLDAGALVTSGFVVGGVYADSLDLSRGTVGLLLGAQTLAFAVGAAGGGRAADLVGRRSLLSLSLVGYVAGVVLLAASTASSGLLVGCVVVGLFIGAGLPASLAVLSETAHHGRRGRAVAMSQLMWGLGIAASGVLALLLADLGELGARLMFFHLAVVASLVLMLCAGVRETLEWQAARRSGPAPSQTRNVSVAAVVTGSYYLLWLIGANTLGQFKAYLWIHVLGGSPREASLLILLPMPLALLGSVVFVRFVDTALRRWCVVTGVAAAMVGWSAMLVAPSRPTLLVLVLLSSLGATLAGEALYKVASQELVPTLARATVQGATMAGARTVAAAFAAVTPWLASNHLLLLIAIVTLAQAVAAAIALAGLPTRPRVV